MLTRYEIRRIILGLMGKLAENLEAKILKLMAVNFVELKEYKCLEVNILQFNIVFIYGQNDAYIQ